MNSSNPNADAGSREGREDRDEIAFVERVVRYQDGALRDAALAEFEAELRNDPNKQRLFAEIQMQAAMVREDLRGRAFTTDEVNEARLAPAESQALLRRAHAVVAVLALCTIFFVAAWLSLESAQDSPVRGVAWLSRAVDMEWLEGEEGRLVGAVLEPGVLRLKSGAALLEFFSGARVVVEGPAELQLVSAHEGFLHSGRISAHVPPPARGFTVRTADFAVVDRGTEFGIAIASDAGAATSEVHVFAGLVEVQTETATQNLGTGKAVRFGGKEAVELPSDQSAFLLEKELEARASAAEQTRFDDWDAARRRLQADSAIVLHEAMVNRTIEQGTVVGCEWTKGRWPQKSALRFSRSADRWRFDVDRPLQQVTLLAWVRIDALSVGMTVLMAVERASEGSLNWLITERGELRLEVGRDLGRRLLDWEAVNSQAVVTRDRFGEWRLLATTFDGLRIRHFIDGQPCGSGASFRPPAMLIGIAEVGNGHAPAMKHLLGALDEFVIVSRVLTEAELRAYWEQSRP